MRADEDALTTPPDYGAETSSGRPQHGHGKSSSAPSRPSVWATAVHQAPGSKLELESENVPIGLRVEPSALDGERHFVVTRVIPKGAAAHDGTIRTGDILVSVNGHPVGNSKWAP
jgi:S1-C subfamily serine protease